MVSVINFAVQINGNAAKSGLADKIRDGVVNFLVDQAKGLVGKEFSDRIAALLTALRDADAGVRGGIIDMISQVTFLAETITMLTPYFDWISSIIGQLELSQRNYRWYKDKGSDFAGCDILFQLLRTYAPGPCRSKEPAG